MEVLVLGVQSNPEVNATVIRLQMEAVQSLTDVIFLTLQTQLVEEAPIVYDTSYVSIAAQRTLRGEIQQTFTDGSNNVVLSDDVIRHLLQDGGASDEVLQVAVSFDYNPYFFGFGDFEAVTSQAVLMYFASANNTEVRVSDLNSTQSVQITLSRKEQPNTDASNDRRRRSVALEDSIAGMETATANVQLEPTEISQTQLDLSAQHLPDGSTLFVWVRFFSFIN